MDNARLRILLCRRSECLASQPDPWRQQSHPVGETRGRESFYNRGCCILKKTKSKTFRLGLLWRGRLGEPSQHQLGLGNLSCYFFLYLSGTRQHFESVSLSSQNATKNGTQQSGKQVNAIFAQYLDHHKSGTHDEIAFPKCRLRKCTKRVTKNVIMQSSFADL